jgi:hypothetical protein
VIDPRKLAAIDIVFLGSTIIVAEFAAGVLLSGCLGVFVLLRSHSAGQLAVGLYLLSLATNYVPMLIYALAITKAGSARLEMGDELNNKREAMRRYRRMSILLLVPLLVPCVTIWREWRGAHAQKLKSH